GDTLIHALTGAAITCRRFGPALLILIGLTPNLRLKHLRSRIRFYLVWFEHGRQAHQDSPPKAAAGYQARADRRSVESSGKRFDRRIRTPRDSTIDRQSIRPAGRGKPRGHRPGAGR